MAEKRPPVNPRPKITVKPQVGKPSQGGRLLRLHAGGPDIDVGKPPRGGSGVLPPPPRARCPKCHNENIEDVTDYSGDWAFATERFICKCCKHEFTYEDMVAAEKDDPPKKPTTADALEPHIEIDLPGIASHEAVSAQLLNQIQTGVQLATVFADPEGLDETEMEFMSVEDLDKGGTFEDTDRIFREAAERCEEADRRKEEEKLTDKEGKLPTGDGRWSAPAQAKSSWLWTMIKWVVGALAAGALCKMVEQVIISL